jgi:hypothetical protein
VSARSSRRATAAASRSPVREAYDTAIATIAAELDGHELPHQVILCTYGPVATTIATEALADATTG